MGRRRAPAGHLAILLLALGIGRGQGGYLHRYFNPAADVDPDWDESPHLHSQPWEAAKQHSWQRQLTASSEGDGMPSAAVSKFDETHGRMLHSDGGSLYSDTLSGSESDSESVGDHGGETTEGEDEAVHRLLRDWNRFPLDGLHTDIRSSGSPYTEGGGEATPPTWVSASLAFLSRLHGRILGQTERFLGQTETFTEAEEDSVLEAGEHMGSNVTAPTSRAGRVLNAARAVGQAKKVSDAVTLLAVAKAWGGSFKQRGTWKLSNPCSKWYGVKCSSPKGFNVIQIVLINQGLRGTISPAIGNLKSLTYLDLSSSEYDTRNAFQGSLPASLSRLTSLRALVIAFTGVRGTVPLYRSLKSLMIVKAAGNRLSGSIPAAVSTLTNLVTLDLGYNFLTGRIPAGMSKLKKLGYFAVYGNGMVGKLPPALGAMPSLTYLILGLNKFSGTLPAALSKLNRLQVLDVGRNFLTGSIPKGFSALRSLNALAMPVNSLSGPLPAFLAQSKQLRILDIASNSFRGSIPASIGTLTQISYFIVASNLFSGPLPAFVPRLRNLRRLNLGANRFTGTIPKSYSSLSLLNNLFLRRNQLSGTIPNIWAGLKSLKAADLSFNQLTGKVVLPPARVSWNVTSNYLTGKGCSRAKSGGNCFTRCPRQRTAKACARFCGTTKKGGACGGKGTCSIVTVRRKRVPVCTCAPGYKRSPKNVATCIKK